MVWLARVVIRILAGGKRYYRAGEKSVVARRLRASDNVVDVVASD